MAKSFDQINKVKEKYEKLLKEKDSQLLDLTEKNEKLESENKELRRKLYEAGEGKGENNSLKKKIASTEREKKTLENKIDKMTKNNLINTFSEERQRLIKNIRNLSFPNNRILDSLAHKFKDGLDNVIEIAYRIKSNSIGDMDYYTFVFRDDIVGLLEKMFRTVLNKKEDSASKYLVKLRDNVYQFPKDYYVRMPDLKNKTILDNILNLINLESVGYHGTAIKQQKLKTNYDTNEKEKYNRFLNLNNDDQLHAIFTLIEFMYDVFTNKDSEFNLMSISASWFKTM